MTTRSINSLSWRTPIILSQRLSCDSNDWRASSLSGTISWRKAAAVSGTVIRTRLLLLSRITTRSSSNRFNASSPSLRGTLRGRTSVAVALATNSQGYSGVVLSAIPASLFPQDRCPSQSLAITRLEAEFHRYKSRCITNWETMSSTKALGL